MDRQPAVPEQNDPLITVEAVAPGVKREPGWALARLAAVKRAVKPTPCRHRVRWRDLQGSKKIHVALVAVMLYVAVLVALCGLFFTVVLASVGVRGANPAALVLAPVLAAVSVQLLVSFAACHRTWYKLHRPGIVMCALSTVVPLPILLITGIVGTAFGLGWLMILVVPPLAPMLVLWWFRSALYELETCEEYPWLPPKILAMRKPESARPRR
ncbi:hypothetical protein [Glycomyces rhizosphaerae]|uniref:Uncharacterized protein n=1 Tax=Glycomyces rhizosphaerae TaxID=2054422 RepID=A0ABV7PY63_9ACTN